MPELSPGKRTLTEMLPVPASNDVRGVQQRASPRAGGEPDAAAIRASAQRGVATSASPLPHLGEIQRLFGRHDISGVQSHTGAEASASARDMGASAYATGNHVVLGDGADLHTVAHEAAHVIQQRSGVACKGGVGDPADAHEQHADAVADRVVRGERAEPLLDAYSPSRGTPSPTGATTAHGTIQRMKPWWTRGKGDGEGSSDGKSKENEDSSLEDVITAGDIEEQYLPVKNKITVLRGELAIVIAQCQQGKVSAGEKAKEKEAPDDQMGEAAGEIERLVNVLTGLEQEHTLSLRRDATWLGKRCRARHKAEQAAEVRTNRWVATAAAVVVLLAIVLVSLVIGLTQGGVSNVVPYGPGVFSFLVLLVAACVTLPNVFNPTLVKKERTKSLLGIVKDVQATIGALDTEYGAESIERNTMLVAELGMGRRRLQYYQSAPAGEVGRAEPMRNAERQTGDPADPEAGAPTGQSGQGRGHENYDETDVFSDFGK